MGKKKKNKNKKNCSRRSSKNKDLLLQKLSRELHGALYGRGMTRFSSTIRLRSCQCGTDLMNWAIGPMWIVFSLIHRIKLAKNVKLKKHLLYRLPTTVLQ